MLLDWLNVEIKQPIAVKTLVAQIVNGKKQFNKAELKKTLRNSLTERLTRKEVFSTESTNFTFSYDLKLPFVLLYVCNAVSHIIAGSIMDIINSSCTQNNKQTQNSCQKSYPRLF